MKKIIFMLAASGFVAACAKKGDNGTVVNVEKPPVAAPAPKSSTPTPSPTPAVAPGTNSQVQSRVPDINSQRLNQSQIANLGAAITIGSFTGTADDYLNQKLTYTMNGENNLDQQARNLTKAKEILNAELTKAADGKLLLELDISSFVESNSNSSQSMSQVIEKKDSVTTVDQAKSLALEVDDLDEISNLKGFAPAKAPVPPEVKPNPPVVLPKQPDQQAQQSPKFEHQNKIILQGLDLLATGQIVRLQANNRLARKLNVRAEVQCVKAMRDCETRIATIYYGDKKNGAKVQIIFRDSTFQFDLKTPKFKTGDSAYDRLIKMFNNSQYMDGFQQVETNVLKLRSFNTFEVINGRTIAKITMQSLENEMIMLKSSLKIAADGGLNTVVDKSINMEQALSISLNSAIRTEMSDAISEVWLVGNDGRGQLTFSLKMRALENNAEDSMTLVIRRMMK